jgi:hypothetical protein
MVRRGSGVFSPATHAHPLLSFLLSERHNTHTTRHPWVAPGPSGRDLNPADLAVLVGRLSLFLPPPYRLPQKDIHTHPWPGGGYFLGKISPPAMRPASYLLLKFVTYTKCNGNRCRGDHTTAFRNCLYLADITIITMYLQDFLQTYFQS